MFIEALNGIRLYQYQVESFMAIWKSIINQLGLTFVVIFSRQSGKDEMIANLVVYLLSRFHDRDATISEIEKRPPS